MYSVRGARSFQHHHFEDILDTFKDGQGYTLDTDLSGDDWVELVGKYKEVVAQTGQAIFRRIRTSNCGRDRRGVLSGRMRVR